jgi:hypothetical protein
MDYIWKYTIGSIFFNISYIYFMDQIHLHTNTCTKLHILNSIQSKQELEQNQLMQLCAPFHNQA